MTTNSNISVFVSALKANLTKPLLGRTNSVNSFFRGTSYNTGWFSKLSVDADGLGISLCIPPMSHIEFEGRRFFAAPQVCIYADRILQEIQRTGYSLEEPCVLLLTQMDFGEFLFRHRHGLFRNKKVFDACYHVRHEEMTSGSTVGWMLDNAFVRQSLSANDSIEQFAKKLMLMISSFCKEISSAFESAGLSLIKDPRFSNLNTKKPEGKELAVFISKALGAPEDSGSIHLSCEDNRSWFLSYTCNGPLVQLTPPNGTLIQYQDNYYSGELTINVDCDSITIPQKQVEAVSFSISGEASFLLQKNINQFHQHLYSGECFPAGRSSARLVENNALLVCTMNPEIIQATIEDSEDISVFARKLAFEIVSFSSHVSESFVRVGFRGAGPGWYNSGQKKKQF